MEVAHGIMKLERLYSDVFSMTSKGLEQLCFGTGECVSEEIIASLLHIQIFI
jgi:hypothetical protein